MTLLIIQTGCDKRLEQPETIDPVYQSYVADQNAAIAAVAEMTKRLEDSKKQFDATKPGDKMKIQLKREVFQQEAALKILEQRELYQTLLVKKRADEARQEYDRAYRNKEEWPNPDSLKRHQANQRLKNAPRNWSARVPKPGAKPATPPPAAAEAPKGH